MLGDLIIIIIRFISIVDKHFVNQNRTKSYHAGYNRTGFGRQALNDVYTRMPGHMYDIHVLRTCIRV